MNDGYVVGGDPGLAPTSPSSAARPFALPPFSRILRTRIPRPDQALTVVLLQLGRALELGNGFRHFSFRVRRLGRGSRAPKPVSSGPTHWPCAGQESPGSHSRVNTNTAPILKIARDGKRISLLRPRLASAMASSLRPMAARNHTVIHMRAAKLSGFQFNGSFVFALTAAQFHLYQCVPIARQRWAMASESSIDSAFSAISSVFGPASLGGKNQSI